MSFTRDLLAGRAAVGRPGGRVEEREEGVGESSWVGGWVGW